MKKILFLLILITFIFANNAWAQNIPTSTNATSSVVTLKEKQAQSIEAIVSKFQNAIDRLGTNASKLTQILNSQAAAGKDVSSASAKLNAAQIKINEAQKGLDNFKISLDKLVGAKGAKKSFATIKAKAMKAEIVKIKDAHKALIEAIQAVRVTKRVQEESSTSTPSLNAGLENIFSKTPEEAIESFRIALEKEDIEKSLKYIYSENEKEKEQNRKNLQTLKTIDALKQFVETLKTAKLDKLINEKRAEFVSVYTLANGEKTVGSLIVIKLGQGWLIDKF